VNNWSPTFLRLLALRSYLNEKLAALVYRTEINGRGEPFCWPRDTRNLLKLALTLTERTGRQYSSLFISINKKRRHVARVWTDVPEEHIASFIRKKRLSKLGTTYSYIQFSKSCLHFILHQTPLLMCVGLMLIMLLEIVPIFKELHG
jgi:hypothetical protein